MKLLDKYTDIERKQWERSKAIVLYEDAAQFECFIENSLSAKDYHKKLYFGKIGKQLADRIENATDIFIEGYNCVLRSDEIRKILKSHGNDSDERARG
jgi:flavin reductase (DIM6/NTAB) family NADH-FMN oxidoreductase RutF